MSRPQENMSDISSSTLDGCCPSDKPCLSSATVEYALRNAPTTSGDDFSTSQFHISTAKTATVLKKPQACILILWLPCEMQKEWIDARSVKNAKRGILRLGVEPSSPAMLMWDNSSATNEKRIY
jgi:hypothetical protein